MASIIKNRLKELCEENNSLQTLWAQWTIDELLITKALNNIGQTFPHYSLHDASHSNQIVTNIERILGTENINLLSATDLWLILESAFCHDIGMVVPMDKIREDWKKTEFKDFLSSIVNDTTHEFNSIAKKYQDGFEYDFLANSGWPLDTLEEVKLLLAEFYRKSHASNASKIIANPSTEIGLNSPRNELLPNRLFRVLGAVSAHHGYSFEDVMSLPKKEVGLGNDEAHPRYIACLLRLGDLLDLDDNRFCPVMLKTAGNPPASTHAHIEKHLSIRHFRMDQNRIEVTAECETYDGYTATSSWFSYLEKEVQQQMMHWDDIVPNKKMGLLPTIGNLDIQLKGYELLSRDSTPKFEVDTDKMFSIIEGSGIYKERFQCIREILQNAADTTLLKLWCDKTIRNKYKTVSFEQPSDGLNPILNDNYSINICIDEIRANDNIVEWEISIEDKGMGINKEGLKFLQNIGSSNKDLRKKALIDSMPYWLKPSGAFGIGFQSIFMITDQVIIRSKSFYDNEVLIVEMNAPNKSKSGNIFIKKEEAGYKYETGSLLKFRFRTKKILNSFSYSLDDENLVAEINNYDFIEDRQLNIDILKLIYQVTKFSVHSYVPIDLIFNGSRINTDYQGFSNSGYFHESGFRIKLIQLSDNSKFGEGTYRSNLLFKGQILETVFTTSFCCFDIDILGFNADEYLEVNRNKLKQSKQNELFEYITEALVSYVKQERNNCNSKDKEYLDAFVISLSSVEDFITGSQADNDKPNIQLGVTEHYTQSVVSASSVTLKLVTYTIKSEPNKNQELEIEKHDDEYIIKVSASPRIESVIFLQNYLLPKYFHGLNISYNKTENKEEKIIEYTKDAKCIIDDSVLKFIMEINRRDRWPRMAFLCPDQYKSLAVENENIGFCEHLHHYLSSSISLIDKNIMVMPFKHGDSSFEKFNFDKLVEWVYENRKNPDTTKSEISETYDKLIAHIKSLRQTS
ncbi:ATP-binding protein [Catenovulum agarivorans]|uniref:HD domain-containing protein n=1 Tax=Catenovulum agarivorans TaxID=1172192 RepID=UPI0002E5F7A9|nr:ATP-binding protein [Catenovulum agarivorans]